MLLCEAQLASDVSRHSIGAHDRIMKDESNQDVTKIVTPGEQSSTNLISVSEIVEDLLHYGNTWWRSSLDGEQFPVSGHTLKRVLFPLG